MPFNQYHPKILKEASLQISRNKLLPDAALWRAIDLLLPNKTPQNDKSALFRELKPQVRGEQERAMKRTENKPFPSPENIPPKKLPETPPEKQLSFKLK